jgi:hypothetical protein
MERSNNRFAREGGGAKNAKYPSAKIAPKNEPIGASGKRCPLVAVSFPTDFPQICRII